MECCKLSLAYDALSGLVITQIITDDMFIKENLKGSKYKVQTVRINVFSCQDC